MARRGLPATDPPGVLAKDPELEEAAEELSARAENPPCCCCCCWGRGGWEWGVDMVAGVVGVNSLA